MKSINKRPSQSRPAGAWIWVSRFGGGVDRNATERPPVSEFESPKLKMAGKLQGDKEVLGHGSHETDARSRSTAPRK